MKKIVSILIATIMLLGTLPQMALANGSIVYDFKKLGLPDKSFNYFNKQEGFDLVGSPTNEPAITHRAYGARIASFGSPGMSKAFKLVLNDSGYYNVDFSGYHDISGGIAEIKIDGSLIGTFDFNGGFQGTITSKIMDNILLEKGEHTLTLSSVGKNKGSNNYGMFPSKIEFSFIDFENIQQTTSSIELKPQEKREVILKGLINNIPTDLIGYEISYSILDDSIATVSQKGVVEGKKAGKTNVVAKILKDKISKDISVDITVYDQNEITFEMESEKSFEIEQDGNYKIRVSDAIVTEKAINIYLDDELIGEYTSKTGEIENIQTIRLTNGAHSIKIDKKAKVSMERQSTNVNSTKTRVTYYTEQKVAAARENAVTYDWAIKQTRNTVALADKYLAKGYDFLWGSITTQELPRGFAVNADKGCLVCGTKINAFGNYPYIANHFDEPFKLQCPNCKSKFPSNDFNAYYKSGLNEFGEFIPNLANKDLLVNTTYPDKGAKWGVDDGFGFVDEKGNKYTFIAYYNHWHEWYTNGVVTIALNTFRDAYLFTGDKKYSRAGIILLDRVADVYPKMDVSKFAWADGFQNSHGMLMQGKVIGSIWENVLVKDFIRAYDAFFPAMDDYTAISFLSEKAKKYKMDNNKETAEAVKKNIEDNIVRLVYPSVLDCKLWGNNGMFQSSLGLAAIVLDSYSETKKWLDFTLQSGQLEYNPIRITGGNILGTFIDDVSRDGQGNEASPFYNSTWLTNYMLYADFLNGYDKYPAADLFKNVKFKKMFTTNYSLMLSEPYSAIIGDVAKTGSPVNYVLINEATKAFEVYREPIYAQLAYYLNKNKTEGLHSDIFTQNPEQISQNVKSIIAEKGTLQKESSNMSGYGYMSFIEKGNTAGDFSKQRDMWMYYGIGGSHGHQDALGLGVHAFGIDLMPDMGYPEYADATAHRTEWVTNSISHNLVMVDLKKQDAPKIKIAKSPSYANGDMVKYFEADASGAAYLQTSLYRRTSAMIKIDDVNSYIVDFFRVKGGSQHTFSFHSAKGEVTTEGLNLEKQEKGTLAGENVPFGERPANDSIAGFKYSGSGYHWLKDVEMDTAPSEKFSIDWKVEDTWKVRKTKGDIHLKLTMLEKTDAVSLANGVPPRNKLNNPDLLRYLIADRVGENLNSNFTSVIEPYENQTNILSSELAKLTVDGKDYENKDIRAVKVTFKNGRVDYIVSSINPKLKVMVDGLFEFSGTFGVYSKLNNEVKFSFVDKATIKDGGYLNDAEIINGEVIDFTKELSQKNYITIKTEKPITVNLKDKYIYFDSINTNNAVYRILNIKPKSENEYILDIGDVSLISKWNNKYDFSLGYTYDIKTKDKFAIPLFSEKN